MPLSGRGVEFHKRKSYVVSHTQKKEKKLFGDIKPHLHPPKSGEMHSLEESFDTFFSDTNRARD